MFGSEVVSTMLYERLTAMSEVQADYLGKVFGLPVMPQSVPLPGIAFYPEFSDYGQPPIGGPINSEQLRFAIKAMCLGMSTDPVIEFAKAQLLLFDEEPVNSEYEGDQYLITMTPNGEVLPTTVVDGDTFYRQLGTVYDVHITRG